MIVAHNNWVRRWQPYRHLSTARSDMAATRWRTLSEFGYCRHKTGYMTPVLELIGKPKP